MCCCFSHRSAHAARFPGLPNSLFVQQTDFFLRFSVSKTSQKQTLFQNHLPHFWQWNQYAQQPWRNSYFCSFPRRFVHPGSQFPTFVWEPFRKRETKAEGGQPEAKGCRAIWGEDPGKGEEKEAIRLEEKHSYFSKPENFALLILTMGDLCSVFFRNFL